MAAGLPTSSVVEVYLNGAWTDITSYVKQLGSSIKQTQGRATQVDDAQPGTLTFTLDGIDGRFLPDAPTIVSYATGAAVTSANPLYPYFVEDAQVRWTVTKGSAHVLFLGWITTITPNLASDPTQSTVVVTATDSLGRLERGTLLTYQMQQMLLDSPTAIYLLDEAPGSTLFNDATGQQPAATMIVKPAGGLTPGDSTPGSVSGAPALLVARPTGTLEASRVNFPPSVALGAAGWTIELCVNIRATVSSGGELFRQISTDGLSNTYGVVINYTSAADGTLTFTSSIGKTPPPGVSHELVVTSPPGFPASGFYHIAVTLSTDGKTGYIWVNGVWATTTIVAPVTWRSAGIPQIKAGNASLAGHDICNVAFYNTVIQGNRINSVASGSTSNGVVYVGPDGLNTVNAMAFSVALFGGFTPTLETGFGPQLTTWVDTKGKTPLAALLDVVRGEGGLLYDDGTGLYGRARSALRSSTVKVTIDAEDDLDGPPVMSRATLNKVASAIGVSVSASVTVTDATATAQVGAAAAGALETSLSDPVELYSVASNRIAQGVYRKTRFSQLTVNLMTAKNDLYAALLALRPGDRIRLSNLPVYLGFSYLDFYVMGWSLDSSYDGFVYVLDTEPADTPPELGFDTFRFAEPAGNSTLNGALTAGQTSMTILSATTSWSTASADYPCNAQVNGELVTIVTAPGIGLLQTFSNVTRGVGGTLARAHSSGESVQVADAITFAF